MFTIWEMLTLDRMPNVVKPFRQLVWMSEWKVDAPPDLCCGKQPDLNLPDIYRLMSEADKRQLSVSICSGRILIRDRC